MSGNEMGFTMEIPLDSDGFLRRECPTCEREFKWLHGGEGDEEGTPSPDGGYFCPYCGIQAADDAWLTRAQLDQAQGILAAGAGSMLKDIFSGPGWTVEPARNAPPEPLTESDDMVRVDFECHPAEPVKVLEDWAKPVHCLICGSATQR